MQNILIKKPNEGEIWETFWSDLQNTFGWISSIPKHLVKLLLTLQVHLELAASSSFGTVCTCNGAIPVTPQKVLGCQSLKSPQPIRMSQLILPFKKMKQRMAAMLASQESTKCFTISNYDTKPGKKKKKKITLKSLCIPPVDTAPHGGQIEMKACEEGGGVWSSVSNLLLILQVASFMQHPVNRSGSP